MADFPLLVCLSVVVVLAVVGLVVAQRFTKLRQSEAAARSASLSKSAFLANMSHEIRTPMHAVIGLTDLALQNELRPRTRDYLTKIASSSRSLLRIVNDILDFSKIEVGKLTLESADFLLQDIFDRLADTFRVQVADKSLELILWSSPECYDHLIGDALRLEQILLNLIGNAIKFTDSGEIEVKVTTSETSGAGTMLQFSVRDTGIGISSEQAGRIFEPFTQADDLTAHSFGGTGLGLSISKELVAMMGGQLWLESEPQQGSTFYFTTTLRRNPELTVANRVLPEAIATIKILVVDDNEPARQALRHKFSLLGLAATAVASGRAALEALQQACEQQQPYQLVLVDWLMPAMDGATTIRHIVTTIPYEQLPKIVMLTSFGLGDN
ncbi:MAG: response regulator, partial [Magnetococcales bacterium]|nr:response regulator [Magnetococcales bacterium]